MEAASEKAREEGEGLLEGLEMKREEEEAQLTAIAIAASATMRISCWGFQIFKLNCLWTNNFIIPS